MRERLDSLIASVPVTSEHFAAWVSAKNHFDEFYKEMQAHERAEIDLIQAASSDDPRTGD